MEPRQTYINVFTSSLRIGEQVSGITVDLTAGRTISRWSGFYVGVEADGETGEDVHMMTDGQINGTPQGCFAHPVAQTVDLAASETCPRCGSTDVGTWGQTGARTDADCADIFGCETCKLEVTLREADTATDQLLDTVVVTSRKTADGAEIDIDIDGRVVRVFATLDGPTDQPLIELGGVNCELEGMSPGMYALAPLPDFSDALVNPER